MDNRESQRHAFPKYGFNFPKTHSASSLSLISTPNNFAHSSLRNDNDETSSNNNNSHNLHNSIINAISSSSSDTDSDTEINFTKPSCMKSTFNNVFSSKNRQLFPDNNNTTTSTESLEKVSNPSKETLINSEPLKANNADTISTKSSSRSINPIIFKKLVSKKALLPRMKAFKRISDDMQMETCPLHDEMQHELMITTAMKEDEEVLNSKACCSSLLLRKNNPQYLLNYDNLKKFEIINKANESWNNNRRKSSSSYTNSEGYASLSRHGSVTNLTLLNPKRRNSLSSLTPTNTNNSATSTIDNNNDNSNNNAKQKNSSKSLLQLRLSNPFTPLRLSRKRKMGNYDEFSTDIEEYFSDDGGFSPWTPPINNKRRLVSSSVTNSPKSPALDPFPSRRNSILIQSIQSASDDLESISLK